MSLKTWWSDLWTKKQDVRFIEEFQEWVEQFTTHVILWDDFIIHQIKSLVQDYVGDGVVVVSATHRTKSEPIDLTVNMREILRCADVAYVTVVRRIRKPHDDNSAEYYSSDYKLELRAPLEAAYSQLNPDERDELNYSPVRWWNGLLWEQYSSVYHLDDVFEIIEIKIQQITNTRLLVEQYRKNVLATMTALASGQTPNWDYLGSLTPGAVLWVTDDAAAAEDIEPDDYHYAGPITTLAEMCTDNREVAPDIYVIDPATGRVFKSCSCYWSTKTNWEDIGAVPTQFKSAGAYPHEIWQTQEIYRGGVLESEIPTSTSDVVPQRDKTPQPPDLLNFGRLLELPNPLHSLKEKEGVSFDSKGGRDARRYHTISDPAPSPTVIVAPIVDTAPTYSSCDSSSSPSTPCE